jgi:hypothetical protein
MCIDTRPPETSAPARARVRRRHSVNLKHVVSDESQNDGTATVTIKIRKATCSSCADAPVAADIAVTAVAA